MVLSLKPDRLKRYKDIVALLIKYGRSDLVEHSNLALVGKDTSHELTRKSAAKAEELADDLEKLGPTFIKLGQLLSTRPDIIPEPYMEALSRLQDHVEPFSIEEVEEIVSTELGARLSKLFANFEREPYAAASLSQVHRAEMRDGRPVVVKVQRPNIRDQIVEDLEALEQAAEFIDAHTETGRRYEFGNLLAELRRSLLRELDFQKEATNLLKLRESLRDFEHIVVPEPIDDYTTSRVLTMEYIAGKKVTDLSPLRLLEIDGMALSEELFRAYLKQFLVDGFFHADPHPGNVFLTEDNRIALLDLGMVGHVGTRFQENLLRLLLAASEGRGDEAAQVCLKMGEPKADFDKTEYQNRIRRLVARHADATLDQIDAGRVVLEIARISADCWMRMPQQFTLIAKALLNLDQVVYTLAPTFDPNRVIREEASSILTRKLAESIEPGRVMSRIVEVKEFADRFPGHINKILDSVSKNEFRIGVDAIDEKVVLDGLQKIANRITLGLILAALIVGAALMMRVETSFKIFGYPGIAMIFFMLAAVASLFLAANILFTDEKPKKNNGD
jgi:ubiquinone biosynthesis protein